MKNSKNYRKQNDPPKNKRILRKKKEARKGRIALIIFFIIVTSPFWLYVGIIRNMILPTFGEKSKAVLTEIRGPFIGINYYDEPDFYYTFYTKGKLYRGNSGIQPNDSLFYLGDTIDIIYLRAFPFINARTSPKDKKK